MYRLDYKYMSSTNELLDLRRTLNLWWSKTNTGERAQSQCTGVSPTWSIAISIHLYYAHFGISPKKKTPDENMKVHINSKNACAQLCWTNLFIRNAHKLWWKHIYRIKSSMCIMWGNTWTNQQSDRIAQHLKYCFALS